MRPRGLGGCFGSDVNKDQSVREEQEEGCPTSPSYLFFFTGVVVEVEAGVLVAFALDTPPGCLLCHKNKQ